MPQSSFGEALSRLWPSGDAKIPGLRAGIIASAPMVFARYGITAPPLAAHVNAAAARQVRADRLAEDLAKAQARIKELEAKPPKGE
jgi:putative chitinase